MDTINELAADERTARIILAVASEPGDAVTGRMIRTVGASETIARVLADEVPPGRMVTPGSGASHHASTSRRRDGCLLRRSGLGCGC